MAIAVQSIKGVLFGDINSLLLDAKFIDENSVLFKKLADDARKLMGNDPSNANIGLAGTYNLSNNRDKVLYHVDLANKLPNANVQNLKLNSSIAMSNVGFYTLSQNYYSMIDAQSGINQVELVECGYGAISYIALNKLLEKFGSISSNMTEFTKDALKHFIQSKINFGKISFERCYGSGLCRHIRLVIK